MEIHSSSLNSIPAGYKNNNKTDESRLSNIVEKNDYIHNQDSITRFPVKEVEKSFKSEDFLQLTNNIKHRQDQPTNSRTARALNSYIQENIEPLKNQRAALISNIDFFV